MRWFPLLLAALPMIAIAADGPADMIYRHGVIHTIDQADRVVQALAIKDGVLVYVGDDLGAKKFTGTDTKIVDLQDRAVLPGLVDGHMHPFRGGQALLKCSLHYAKLTIAELQSRIQACLDQQPAAKADLWLEVVDWFQQDMQPPGTVLSYRTLDALKTERPVMVRSSFGHTTLVNRRGMALAGLTDAVIDPPGGHYGRDPDGHLDGNLEDNAQQAVIRLLPKPTEQENRAAAKAALAALRAQGVTSFLEASSSPESIAAFSAVQKEGGLTARAHFTPLILPEEAAKADRAVSRVAAMAKTYDMGEIRAAPTITVRNAKLYLDGVIAAPALTGNLMAPYRVNRGSAEQPLWQDGSSRGPKLYFPPRLLKSLVIKLGRAGIEAHLHADGDGAVHAALDAVAALRVALRDRDLRIAIAHDEMVAPEDFKRFAALNAIPVLSFQWEKRAPDTVDELEDYIGPERFKIVEPAGLLAAAGARIAYGSDWPVDPLDEWFALKVAVTRRNSAAAGDKYVARLGEDPGLSASAAIRAITVNAAYELHMDDKVGSLEVGKLADFIVLDRDPLKIEADRIADVKILRTVVGGQTVYQAP